MVTRCFSGDVVEGQGLRDGQKQMRTQTGDRAGCSQSIRHPWSSPGKKMQNGVLQRTGPEKQMEEEGQEAAWGLEGKEELEDQESVWGQEKGSF